MHVFTLVHHISITIYNHILTLLILYVCFLYLCCTTHSYIRRVRCSCLSLWCRTLYISVIRAQREENVTCQLERGFYESSATTLSAANLELLMKLENVSKNGTEIHKQIYRYTNRRHITFWFWIKIIIFGLTSIYWMRVVQSYTKGRQHLETTTSHVIAIDKNLF